MLLARLLLLPFAVASTVTLYVSSVPASEGTEVVPSAIPLAHIDYDADQSVGTIVSYTPPTGSYSEDQLLRVGYTDPKTGSWRGIVTSAASFADQYHKKFVVHVDEQGAPYHVGLGTSAKSAGKDVEVEIVKRSTGPKPVLNKPIVLNAEGKLDEKEPEKTLLQKYVLLWNTGEDIELTLVQVLVGSGVVRCVAARTRRRRRQIDFHTANQVLIYLRPLPELSREIYYALSLPHDPVTWLSVRSLRSSAHLGVKITKNATRGKMQQMILLLKLRANHAG